MLHSTEQNIKFISFSPRQRMIISVFKIILGISSLVFNISGMIQSCLEMHNIFIYFFLHYRFSFGYVFDRLIRAHILIINGLYHERNKQWGFIKNNKIQWQDLYFIPISIPYFLVKGMFIIGIILSQRKYKRARKFMETTARNIYIYVPINLRNIYFIFLARACHFLL